MKGSKGLDWINSILPFETDECLLYPYSKDSRGYGLVGGFGSGKSKSAHRLVYQMVYGVEPDTVLHTCDVRACCNKRHLRNGTQADNNKDRANKGRSAKEVLSRRALTKAQTTEIRRRYDPTRVGIKAPNGVKQLARDYNVDPNVIYRVLDGTYKEAI